MHFPRSPMARAVLLACAAYAHSLHAAEALPEITVTTSPLAGGESAQIHTPARVLSGDDLRDRQAGSLGETLSHELGVSSSAFGAGAARPIIRGLDGARVKMLQNGMSVSDVSTLSNDHAVATDTATARQIEILRGPAALLYGSGAIGGLVNVVNERIPTSLAATPTGEAELRYGSVDQAKSLSLSLDGAAGAIGLHLDGNLRNAFDYRIPERAVRDDPDSASGRVPNTFSRQNSLGFGLSTVQSWGYIGASVSTLDKRYGIPTEELAQIDMQQTRYDIDSLVRNPFAGFESARLRLGYTDYQHDELDAASVPQTNFRNRAFETRLELTHQRIAGWRGTLGMQADNARFSALAADGGGATVPATRSDTLAGFLVEEKDFGPLRLSAGARLESVRRRPAELRERRFDLGSWSLGGLWAFQPGYGLGLTGSLAQRAPSTEELYSSGPHEATATFDVGNPDFGKETSRNIELSLQKTDGLLRWKANLFYNRVKNFVYGDITGNTLDDTGAAGGEFNERIFRQGEATIRGAEAELAWNPRGAGWSGRLYADTSRGTLENAGNLPLQPASRAGVDVNYRQGPWRGGVSLLRALRQDRLAVSETSATPGYTQLDASLAYTQNLGRYDVTWFMVARNLLNEDIRFSTSVLKDQAPQPGRNLIVGVRTMF
ncbi:MAG: TonB-dependent receptor [Noviherbaspirillum sp.]